MRFLGSWVTTHWHTRRSIDDFLRTHYQEDRKRKTERKKKVRGFWSESRKRNKTEGRVLGFSLFPVMSPGEGVGCSPHRERRYPELLMVLVTLMLGVEEGGGKWCGE